MEARSRNATCETPVQGGSILADIHTIEGEDPPTAARWKRSFLRMYALDFHSFHRPLFSVLGEIIKTANMLATILLVDRMEAEAQGFEKQRCIDLDFSLSKDPRGDYQFIVNWYRKVELESPR